MRSTKLIVSFFFFGLALLEVRVEASECGSRLLVTKMNREFFKDFDRLRAQGTLEEGRIFPRLYPECLSSCDQTARPIPQVVNREDEKFIRGDFVQIETPTGMRYGMLTQVFFDAEGNSRAVLWETPLVLDFSPFGRPTFNFKILSPDEHLRLAHSSEAEKKIEGFFQTSHAVDFQNLDGNASWAVFSPTAFICSNGDQVSSGEYLTYKLQVGDKKIPKIARLYSVSGDGKDLEHSLLAVNELNAYGRIVIRFLSLAQMQTVARMDPQPSDSQNLNFVFRSLSSSSLIAEGGDEIGLGSQVVSYLYPQPHEDFWALLPRDPDFAGQIDRIKIPPGLEMHETQLQSGDQKNLASNAHFINSVSSVERADLERRQIEAEIKARESTEFPVGFTRKVVSREISPLGIGFSYRSIRIRDEGDKFSEGRLEAWLQKYPKFSRSLGVSIDDSQALGYPSRDLLNFLLEHSPYWNKILYRPYENLSSEADNVDPLDFVRSLADGKFLYPLKGHLHFKASSKILVNALIPATVLNVEVEVAAFLIRLWENFPALRPQLSLSMEALIEWHQSLVARLENLVLFGSRARTKAELNRWNAGKPGVLMIGNLSEAIENLNDAEKEFKKWRPLLITAGPNDAEAIEFSVPAVAEYLWQKIGFKYRDQPSLKRQFQEIVRLHSRNALPKQFPEDFFTEIWKKLE